MTSDPKIESPDDPGKKQPDDNVENEKDRNVWDGTVRTLKLSIMKTGIFGGAKVREALQERQDQDGTDASIEPSLEADVSASDAGSNPYDSSWKK